MKFPDMKHHIRDLTLFQEWYILDENSLPPVYQLQPIQTKFPNYYSLDPVQQEKDKLGWSKVFSELQSFLRLLVQYGVDKGRVSAEQALLFQHSGEIVL